MSKGATSMRKTKVISNIVLIIAATLWILPTFGLAVVSLRESTEGQRQGWWNAFLNFSTSGWTTQAYESVFGTRNLGESFVASIAVTLPATILPLLFAAYAAYGFTFMKFRGREFIFSILIGLLVIPLQAALVPILKMFLAFTARTGIEISGQYAAAWFVHSAFAMPLAVYILRNYMMSIPSALIEAARVDGASNYKIFWRLVLPISVPALASFAIFQFLWVWNDYLIAFVYIGNEHPVLTYTLLSMLGQYGEGWQTVAAGSFVSMAIPLMIFFGLQRYFIRGLTAGAVK
ncbi:MAG: carbohydrate ABC transporter permease [Candidatus Nanopelagicaceae bacterium]|jgi:alpha-glucoside transport system permease protein|nr:carbohydrate ABC transporter permease [Candidatus Nanopelagicaceae bacterium]